MTGIVVNKKAQVPSKYRHKINKKYII